MQWAQDPSQNNVDNLSNVKREASRHFRNKNKEYLKSKIEEHVTNSKILLKDIRDLYRDISDLKKRYQPRTRIVQNGKSDLVTYSQSILAMWRSYFPQLLNVRGVNDIRPTEIHTAHSAVCIATRHGLDGPGI